jgi:putative DNA primase/helicase
MFSPQFLGRSWPSSLIVRGKPLPDVNRDHARRLLHRDRKTGEEPTFTATPRHWLLVDIDHLPAPAATDARIEPEAAIQYLIGLLPPEFHDVSCWWAFSSSQGLPGTEESLSAHLWYWAARPYSDAELKRWATVVNRAGRVVDGALFNAVQAHYVAAPLFSGLDDPLPRRCGVWQGLEDELELVLPPPHPKRPGTISAEGYEPGLGVAAYLDRIGGTDGFRRPIFETIASFVAIYGSKADPKELYRDIRTALDRVEPDWRTDPKGQRYADNEHLDQMLDWIRHQHGDQPPKGWTQPPPDWFDERPPAEPEEGPPDPRPVVRTGGGRLPQAVDEAERILIETDHEVYTFGDQVVRPALRPIAIADDKTTIGLRLVPIGAEHMAERFGRLIDFRKLNAKTQEWVSIDCPRNFAATYLARVGLWRLPQLRALSTCPLLLADGRILLKAGFDAASGVLFDAQGVQFPPVPARPTRDEAAVALETLMHPFRDFPFVDDASKSVLRSLLLTTVSRYAYPFAPCHAFDAPAAGTGKSKLFNCASILMTGRECAVISQPEDEVEFEKKLFAELLAGDPMVSIDNCTYPFESSFLCMVLTQTSVKSRLLGLSKNPEIPVAVIIGANGNNFSYGGDMLRRGLTGHLDAAEEKPWERVFDSEDPVIVFKRERPKLAGAALTVLRAYIAAGRPVQEAPPLGGFEAWCRTVRDALLWLGTDDPCLTIESARKADPARQKFEAIVTEWRSVLKDRSVTTREVIDEACNSLRSPTQEDPDHRVYFHPNFRNALLDIAAVRGHVDVSRLGTWLGNNKGKVIDHIDPHGYACVCRLVADPPLHGHGRWRLEQQLDGSWQ